MLNPFYMGVQRFKHIFILILQYMQPEHDNLSNRAYGTTLHGGRCPSKNSIFGEKYHYSCIILRTRQVSCSGNQTNSLGSSCSVFAYSSFASCLTRQLSVCTNFFTTVLHSMPINSYVHGTLSLVRFYIFFFNPYRFMYSR